MNNNPNPSFNDWLTEITNCELLQNRRYISKKQREFLRIAYDTNVIKGNYFSKHDFSGMKDNNFRQYIRQLKLYIVKAYESRPAFYHLKGIIVDKLTINHTIFEISLDWDELIKKCKEQPPAIHNLRIETMTQGLYEGMKKVRIPNKNNKSITLKIDDVDITYNTKVNIHPNGKLLLMVGCTHTPIPYKPSGFQDLIEYLGKVADYLMRYSQTDYKYSRVRTWKFTYYHFNKDFEVTSPFFKYTIDQLEDHSRLYLHEFPDGKRAWRLEYDVKPDTTISEEQEKSALSEDERKLSEWFNDDTTHNSESENDDELN